MGSDAHGERRGARAGSRPVRHGGHGLAALVWGWSVAAGSLWAQAGDVAGEEQPDLPPDLVVPEAPVLTPAEALERFQLVPGAKIELVAAEPLVVDPVAAAFGGDGDLWVVEMRGYMPNIEGRGEDQPSGVIAVLSDTDKDGRMDTRRVFLDGLVLPRALHPALGGCLVLAPPELALWRDSDGDGRADTKEVIDTGLAGLHSPEHAINGILYQPDNWYRVANAPQRYRRIDGVWRTERTVGGGQWGLTQDELGRAIFNTNPDPVRGDLFPSHYAVRNPNLGVGRGGNVRLAHDMEVWPARINTGVNRGYRPGTLRDDYTLRVFTAACGPCYLAGQVFVCEPAGNLIKRYALEQGDGVQRRALPVDGQREFLTSTDERFRPVNLIPAPDGSLLLVDFYRGLIQHRIFLTSWLRKETLARGLDRPGAFGRLWRVLPPGAHAQRAPDLYAASWSELVEALSHPTAWVRLTAQRLLVEEGRDSREAWELLRRHALEAPSAAGRRHALWALEGTAGLDPEFVGRALEDGDPTVLHAALRVAEPWLAGGDPALTERAARVAARFDARSSAGMDRGLRLQVLHSLGSAATRAGDRWLARMAGEDCADAIERDAIVGGLFQRELRFLAGLLSEASWRIPAPGRAELLSSLARCCVRQGIAEEVEELLALALGATDWQREALLKGVISARPRGPLGTPVATRLSFAPPSAAALGELPDAVAQEAYGALVWPGKPGVSENVVRALTADEERRFGRGREIYASVCAACHQPSGRGEAGKAPPLWASPFVLGAPDILGRILLFGLGGELELQGQRWNAEMPALSASDADLAAVMTYIRREWGNGADPVDAAQVSRLRRQTAERSGPWTVQEIRALMGE